VVLEVSMGGRTDTTNVIPAPLVTVITPISYDHMSILGNTLTEIATEKAGIIKEGTVVVSAPQETETQKVLERTCAEKNVSLEYTKAPIPIARSLQGQSFKLDRIYKTKLLGTYQIENASTALLVIDKLREKGLSISDNAVDQGIAKTEWFGRFTVLRETPYVIVDGGHNRQGAAVLRSSLEEYFPGKKITFLLGILADKEVDIILDELMPIAGKCYVAAVPNKRTMDPQILAGMIKSRGVEATVLGNDIPLENIINENDITCIMGSLYLIKKILGNAV
jgi:dihydrofolate synthase/folylpolyglutamate synthase